MSRAQRRVSFSFLGRNKTKEVVTNAAKSTIAGSAKTAEGMMDQAKGSAKKAQGQAESKAEEVKQKI